MTESICISFPEVNKFEVCQLDIQSAKEPVMVSMNAEHGGFQKKFYVRLGSSSKVLSPSKKQSYLSAEFLQFFCKRDSNRIGI